MKKAIAIILAAVIVASVAMVGCSKKTDDSTSAPASGLADNNDEYNLDGDGDGSDEEETEVVTDENGETVTDKSGNPVTQKVKKDSSKNKNTTTTTMKYNGNESTTEAELTTKDVKDDKVPTTSAKGTPVQFSAKDQTALKDMLEVPYLYNASYENADGVPIEIASHAAIWMAQRDGLNTTAYASGTIVLDLFKYFGQTVVNFKTKCNDGKGNADITYNSAPDTFTIPSSEAERQKVSLTSIESLGNNNYYKVTATVSGAGSISKVVAVVQRNKLDSSLGFSIKALRWS